MKRSIFTLLAALWLVTGTAQFPVTSMPQLVPPHSVFMSDYIVPGSDKFTLNIWLNDHNEVDYDVRLIIQIEGEGVSLMTKPDFTPPPLTLSAGGNILYGGDLQEYFNLNNLWITGIDEQTLMQTGVLPPGMYTFCVQAFDYRRPDVMLSQRSCTTVALSKNNPPLPTFPECGTVIPANTQSNLLFQWQSMADNTIQAEYNFSLVEVPEGISPDDALNGSGRQMIGPGEGITIDNRFVFDINEFPLEPGRTYAYRIQVRDTEGFTTFENDGISQSCSFFYGLPEGGTIGLRRPSDGNKLKSREDVSRLRFAWDKPTNAYPNQLFHYEMQIVALEANQTPEEALLSNTPVWDTIMDPKIYLSGGDISTKIELPLSNIFAWQVTALVEDHEFAKSPIWTFNKGGVIDEFYAGDLRVIVDETSTFDLNHLSGKGRVKLAEGEEYTKVNFTDIAVVSGVDNRMVRGEIITRLKDYNVDLNFADNGVARFRGDSLIITTEDLYLQGQVEWDYPFATNQTSGIAQILSKPKRMLYNDLSLLDRVYFEEASFELLDPFGYKTKYLESSIFKIAGKELTTVMNVEVTLSDKITTTSGGAVMIPFTEQSNVNTLINEKVTGVSGINFLKGTTLTLNPQTAVCDFSEEESPGKQSATPGWKGMYFNKFAIHFDQQFDKSNQIVMTKAADQEFILTDNSEFKGWVDAQGLQLMVQRGFKEESMKAAFNTFKDELQSVRFNIVNNSVEEGYFKGKIQVPVLDPVNPFTYTVPIDDDGLKSGFLDEDLSTREVVFNDDTPDARLVLKPKQAIFKDNSHINMVADLDWNSIQVYLPSVSNLNIYGNGDFGFDVANGSKGVTNVEGLFNKTYDITIDSISAGMHNGLYAFGFIGSVVLGDTEAGISGPSEGSAPKFNMISAEIKGTVSDRPTPESNWLVEKIKDNAYNLAGGDGEKIPMVVPIYLKTAVAEVKGRIVSLKDNPDWGNAFYGALDIKVKKPKSFKVAGKILVGKKDDFHYWFAEVGVGAGSPDKKKTPAKAISSDGAKIKGQRVGIKLGKIEIVEVKGRVYHHMNHDMSKAMNTKCDLSSKTTTREALIQRKFEGMLDIDISDLLSQLSLPDIEKILCRLAKKPFEAVLSALPEPDYNYLKVKIPEVDWGGIRAKYPGFTYGRAFYMFPQNDWCNIIAHIPGFDFGSIKFKRPYFPNLCDLNQYLWNKVIGEFDDNAPIDGNWLVENKHFTEQEITDFVVGTLRELSSEERDASLIDFTGPEFTGEIKGGKITGGPSVNWTDLTKAYPNKNWCGIILMVPDIDWRNFDIEWPVLIMPDWRKLLPRIDIDLSALPDIPDIEFEKLQAGKAINISYKPDATTSYGGMIMVGIQDALTSGRIAQGRGTLELSLDKSYQLKQIGLQIEAGFINEPGSTDFSDSQVQAVGCFTYTTATETFIADLEAEARKNFCANGRLHLQISPGKFNLELGAEAEAKRVRIVPNCKGGFGGFGWVYVDREDGVTDVGGGIGVGLYSTIESDEFGWDGVCTIQGFFKARAELGAKFNAQVEPSFKLKNAGIFFNASVDVGVSINGAICPFGDINALHLGLRGDLLLNFEKEKLTGTVTGEAELFGIIDAEFDFRLNVTI